MTILDEQEDKWGDTQLTATNISAPRLLARADWSAFFRTKGFETPYPMVLYASDEADRLYSDLVSIAGAAQSPDRERRLHIELFTRFVDRETDEVEGAAWMVLEGLATVPEPLREDLTTLLTSGATDWLTESYSGEGITPLIKQVEQLPEDLEAENPTAASPDALILRATIRPIRE